MFKYVNNKDIVSKKIKISKLLPQLKHTCWDNISPMQVIKNKSVSPANHARIKKADLRYPIMIDSRIDDHHNFNIVDGMHRLSKAHLLGKKYIRAYIFDEDLMKKFIVSKRSNGRNYVKSLSSKDVKKIYQERFGSGSISGLEKRRYKI